MTTKDTQVILNKLGYGPLAEDGKPGAKTTAALKKFQSEHGLEADGKVGSKTIVAFALACPVEKPQPINTTPKGKLFSVDEMILHYGEPGASNLTIIDVPYKMKVAWDLTKFTQRIQCHKLIAEDLQQVFSDILQHYGIEEIQRLGIDLYGGCYNFRPMRGTELQYAKAIAAKNMRLAATYLSKHSWGTAIDLDPIRNPLKASHTVAQFAKPAYKPMIDIFYKNGFVGLGPEKDYDWMHFQIGK